MCGRYGRYSGIDIFSDIVNGAISSLFDDSVSYNRPPGTFQLVALMSPDTGEITLGPAWWGFIPGWATDTRLSPINARSETAADKPLFARSFAHQRCVVAADYWIEWQRRADDKQPFAIQPAGGHPFFFAGVWSKASRLPTEHAAAGQVTFAILTGPPNEAIDHIHNRQPQALTADGARAWLNPDLDRGQCQALLETERHVHYTSWPIGADVGTPSNDGPELLERADGPRA